jgi:cytochrome c
MMKASIFSLLAVVDILATLPASAADLPIERGRAFAQANCASCHAIGPDGVSPLSAAPPFRALQQRYPVEDLEESLAEGIMTAHRAMPQFRLEVGQINDLIIYLKSIQR